MTMDRQKLINKLESLSLPQKILIGAGSIILLTGIYFFFFFKPQYNKLNTLKKDIESLEKTIATYQKKISKLPTIKKHLNSKKQELIYAKTLLPETKHEVENLLSEIEKLGKDVGVEFLLFSPGQENKHKFYATRQVTLRLRGHFHNLMQFFSKITSLNRLVTLERLQLKPDNKQEKDQITLLADSHIAIYRALTQQELVAQKNKNKKR